MPEFSKKEQNDFYNSQPRKSIGVAAWLQDSEGRLLIAKPSYKKGWSLIGGMVDKNESPLDAVVRETHEEIRILLDKTRFTLAGYRYVEPRDGRNEDSQMYLSAQLTPDEVGAIVLQGEELSDYKFVSYAQLSDYADSPRIQAVIAAVSKPDFPFYIVNETRVL